MSVLSRQRVAEAEAEAEGGRMQPLARPIVLVRAAVPLAKTAGMAARDGARSAATWAAPRIDDARAWTAPRIEQSGLAIRDTIAPMVCEKLIAAARRVDVAAPRLDVPPPRRRWPQVVAGTIVVAAVGAAAAVVVLRRRKDDRTGGASGEAAEASTGTPTAQDGQLPADADGSGAEANISRPSSAT